ncbi:hypothetical protein [uncultured Phenylobacterium sp.]|uniref:hypothetical protein n=1 Tax=uncultured Phenylobacterium sp. TaxID=349273 RepID=UPI0025F92574|nr:hypothetical protein [uncultured Phenylobacterium sp.]
MQAIHLVCRREGALLKNLSPIDPVRGRYRSGFWNLGRETAQALVGGWVYLHETKARRSAFGGKVLRWREVLYRGERLVEFDLQYTPNVREQKWRGEAHGRAWTGGLVVADLAHEEPDRSEPGCG